MKKFIGTFRSLILSRLKEKATFIIILKASMQNILEIWIPEIILMKTGLLKIFFRNWWISFFNQSNERIMKSMDQDFPRHFVVSISKRENFQIWQLSISIWHLKNFKTTLLSSNPSVSESQSFCLEIQTLKEIFIWDKIEKIYWGKFIFEFFSYFWLDNSTR